MNEEECIARELEQLLRTAGVEASAEGRGVHWRVLAKWEEYSLNVSCFWYGTVSALNLGMNPANARTDLAPRPAPRYSGPEYYTTLLEGGRPIADGRSRIAQEVVSACLARFESGDLSTVRARAPFVDAGRQAMLPLTEGLEGREWELTGDPGFVLWVHGERRSCSVTHDGGTYSCQLHIGQVVVAQLDDLSDLTNVVRVWLDEQVAVTGLRRALPSVHLARHAELLESDPARWHWLHVDERVNDESVYVAAAPRRCTFMGLTSIEMATATEALQTRWPSIEAAVEATVHFLEMWKPLENFVEAAEGGIKPVPG